MGEGKSLIFKVPSSKHLLCTRPAGLIWWGEMERHCLSERSSKKQLRSLPQPRRFGAHDMAHPCPEHALPQTRKPWHDQILLARDVHAARNTCFAQREIQMPVLHLSPAFWCGFLWVLLSFCQEPLSVLLCSLHP